MALTCESALLNLKGIQVDQYDQVSLLLLPFARRFHAEAELRGLKIFMANDVYRIKKCGTLALTKDSLYYLYLYKLINDCVSTNQLFVVHLVLYRPPFAFII
jgi:hypothetical protein